ncbi:MAG: hypothetical protein Q7S61_06260 [bacterium]|nr:hypothetical protein [bacterium]
MSLTKCFSMATITYMERVVEFLSRLVASSVFAQTATPTLPELMAKLPFSVPSLGDLLTFFIRFFFVLAGLAALIYLLLGAFAWVTSGGSKEAVDAAQKKIQAAIVGLILIVAVLAIIVTMEQVVFRQAICIGITCPVTIPNLIHKCPDDKPIYNPNHPQADTSGCAPA